MLLSKAGHLTDAVDINPEIEKIAALHFGFDLPKDHVFITDGRQFLTQSNKNYDFIILDAFNSDQVAWHLLSKEALNLTRKHLKDYGMLAINFTSTSDGDDVASLQATLKSVFPHVRLFDQGNKHGLTSLVFIASSKPINLSLLNPQLSQNQIATANQFLKREIGDLGGTILLSDDFNPLSYQRRQVQIQWRNEMRDYLGNDQQLLLYN